MSAFGDKLAHALGQPAPRVTGVSLVHAPACPYCGERAQLVTGSHVYPHRPDLYQLKFWACDPCSAHVGCHKTGAWTHDAQGERIFSDGTLPLGRLANAELRKAKQRVHEAFDPLWQDASQRTAARLAAYAWLAQEMGLTAAQCHIGCFDVEQCEQAALLADARLAKLYAGDESMAFTG